MFPRVIAAVVCFTSMACGCTRESPPPPPRALDVEISGCLAISRERVCMVDREGIVRVNVRSTDPVTFYFGEGGSIPAERLATIGDETLYRLRIANDVTRVQMDTRSPIGPARATLVLDRQSPPPWLEEGRRRASAGDHDGAVALYRERRGDADPALAALAAGQAARVELSRGRVDASAAWFRQAIALDREAGRLSDAVDDTLALVFALSQRSHRYEEARAALDAIGDLLAAYPDGLARAPYYRALIHSEAGNRRAALRELRDAKWRAERLGLARLARIARTMIAVQLEQLGRIDESLAIRRALDAEADGEPCDRLALRTGIGFGLLLTVVRGGDRGRLREATEVLDRARADTGCQESYLRAVLLGHLAFASLLDGRPVEAAASLEAARALAVERPLTESFFWLDLEGRIALAQKRPARALTVYDEMERRAHAALVTEYEWAALAGRGSALEAMKRTPEALRAYAHAEELLDDVSLAIPVGEGRARFLIERERSAMAAIDLLVAAGKSSEAFHWARRARRRTLAGIEGASRLDHLSPGARARWDAAIGRYAEERAAIDQEAAGDWKLLVTELEPARQRRRSRESALRSALEELLAVLASERDRPAAPLPSPPPGDLFLLYYPSARGWTGFAADARAILAFSIAPFDPSTEGADLAHRLLGPASAWIDRATRIRALLPGGLAHVDLHALPWRGEPLIARVPVEYALDLGDARRAEGTNHALVVGDPQRNLPEARREAHDVASALARMHDTRVDLLSEDRATHASVMKALGAASLFHYAGHATYEGEDGWDSALPLAGGGHLLVADVLTLPQPPVRVVLSGCSAAHTASESPGDTLGIAQAFLVAGSDSVIAPTRTVSDTLSTQFAAELYAAMEQTSDPGHVLRTALLRLRERAPNADWSNFRLLRR
jgi:tetratricopeptide (TPR) repeat protein